MFYFVNVHKLGSHVRIENGYSILFTNIFAFRNCVEFFMKVSCNLYLRKLPPRSYLGQGLQDAVNKANRNVLFFVQDVVCFILHVTVHV
jgi:hypothetical protein